eukprot:527448-Prymnesium_polylepis.1
MIDEVKLKVHDAPPDGRQKMAEAQPADFGEMAASSSQDQKNDTASRFKETNARTIVIIYRLDPSKHLGKVYKRGHLDSE